MKIECLYLVDKYNVLIHIALVCYGKKAVHDVSLSLDNLDLNSKTKQEKGIETFQM